MKKEKIYVVTTAHPFDDARIFFREIKSLAVEYRVVYLAQGSRNQVRESIEMFDLVPGIGFKNRFLRNIKSFVFLFQKKPKIIHFHDLEFSFFAIILKALRGSRIIFDKHEFATLTIDNRSWVPVLLKPILKSTVLLFEKVADFFADETIVANPLQLNKNRKATLLMNLPPANSYSYYSTKKDYRKICYIGDITFSRGGWKLLDIINKLPAEYSLYLVGKIRDEELSDKIKNNKKIRYLGYVPNNEISKRLESVGVGIVSFLDKPQYRKSIPSKYFDYMGLGVVVVAPTFVKESFGDTTDFTSGSFFVDDSLDSFTGAIINLQELDINKLSRENRDKFINHYKWEKEAPKLLKVYKKIFQRIKK